MISTQWALVQRELWEHRSIFVTPAVIGGVVLLMAITGQVSVSAFSREVDLAILGASNLGERERSAAVSVLTSGITMLFAFAMAVLTVFYLLDSLYTERKDKSILFWRSLPVTDAETVLSKVLVAVLAIPVIALAAVIVTHLAVLAVSSLWIGARGGDGWYLLWQAAPFLANWTATLILFIALPLWFLPLAGWFLFVSAWTKRSPFLMAILPLIVLPMLERIFIGSTLFRDAIYVRSAKLPLFTTEDGMQVMFGEAHEGMRLPADTPVTMLGFMDVGGFLASPSLWIGLVVGGLFISAAVYIRRYRDES